MECIVSIDEAYRNLLMALTWVPSLLLAGLVFTGVLLLRRRNQSNQDVNRTLYAIGSGAATLFATWGLLLWASSQLICS